MIPNNTAAIISWFINLLINRKLIGNYFNNALSYFIVSNLSICFSFNYLFLIKFKLYKHSDGVTLGSVNQWENNLHMNP